MSRATIAKFNDLVETLPELSEQVLKNLQSVISEELERRERTELALPTFVNATNCEGKVVLSKDSLYIIFQDDGYRKLRITARELCDILHRVFKKAYECGYYEEQLRGLAIQI